MWQNLVFGTFCACRETEVNMYGGGFENFNFETSAQLQFQAVRHAKSPTVALPPSCLHRASHRKTMA